MAHRLPSSGTEEAERPPQRAARRRLHNCALSGAACWRQPLVPAAPRTCACSRDALTVARAECQTPAAPVCARARPPRSPRSSFSAWCVLAHSSARRTGNARGGGRAQLTANHSFRLSGSSMSATPPERPTQHATPRCARAWTRAGPACPFRAPPAAVRACACVPPHCPPAAHSLRTPAGVAAYSAAFCFCPGVQTFFQALPVRGCSHTNLVSGADASR